MSLARRLLAGLAPLAIAGLVWLRILNGTVASVELGRGLCAFLGLAFVFARLAFVS